LESEAAAVAVEYDGAVDFEAVGLLQVFVWPMVQDEVLRAAGEV
jgi:hypothetical protein